MWDVPRYRIRAYLRNLKQANLKRKAGRRHVLHVRRADGQIRIIEGLATSIDAIPAKIILNDFFPTHMTLYTSIPLLEGQQVSVTLSHPRVFFVKGRIVNCSNQRIGSRVLSTNPFQHRLQVVFEFQSSYERNAVLRFYKELVAKVLFPLVQPRQAI
jgi:hypothetical protein